MINMLNTPRHATIASPARQAHGLPLGSRSMRWSIGAAVILASITCGATYAMQAADTLDGGSGHDTLVGDAGSCLEEQGLVQVNLVLEAGIAIRIALCDVVNLFQAFRPSQTRV